MKRTAISILLLLVLAALVIVLRLKFGNKKSQANPIEQHIQTWQVSALLKEESNNTQESWWASDVSIDNLEWYAYEGWGEYRLFLPQTAKDALSAKKNVVLFFYAEWDPSDKALDIDLQKRSERIPKNMIILRVPYDESVKLREEFDIKNQNTLIWLNASGTEITRRSIGITSLSQIVRVQP